MAIVNRIRAFQGVLWCSFLLGMAACELKPLPCAAPGDCATGLCVDGVCCNTACDETCMACNVAGNVGTCVPVPLYEDDANATQPCIGSLSSCNGSGSCKGEIGQTCTSNAQCSSGVCNAGSCAVAMITSGPLAWVGEYIDPALGVESNCSSTTYSYPSAELSAIVARADGSVMGLGHQHLGAMRLSGGVGECGNGFVYHVYGPHPFTFEGDAIGNLTDFQSIGFVDSRKIWSSPTCQGYCPADSHYVYNPGIWPAGDGVALHHEQWFSDGEHVGFPDWEKYTLTCTNGELTTPTFSLSTVDTCALHPDKIAGDAAGNIIAAHGSSLTKYDPSGQVAFTIPNPFGSSLWSLPNCPDSALNLHYSYRCHRQENPLSIGPQGAIHAGARTNTSISLAKADSLGALQWSKTFAVSPQQSGTTNWASFSYAVDASGDILVAFDATSAVDLGNGPMPSLGANDLILAKLDALGNLVWAKRFGGPGFSVTDCTMRLTGTHDLALVLRFSGAIDLGDGVLQSSPVLAKFNSSGTLAWHSDLVTLMPSPYTFTGKLVLSGHPSGAVFVGGTGRPPPPTTCDGDCCFPGGNYWFTCTPWPIRLVLAKYYP